MEQQLDDLAFKFFKLFAKYESSLKQRDYFQVNDNGKISVDWDSFSNEVIGNTFIDQLGDKVNSANFILESPPKRQAVNEHKKIIWEEVPNTDKSVQALFGHLCRMRNNLFHGAKFNGTWFDPERSKELLKHGLIVLEHFSGKALTNDS